MSAQSPVRPGGIRAIRNQYDYLAEDKDQAQWPMANIFVRRDGKIHHSWGSELLFRPYPTGNTRHIDIMWPLWNVLDLTPEGRGKDWYPALEYEETAP